MSDPKKVLCLPGVKLDFILLPFLLIVAQNKEIVSVRAATEHYENGQAWRSNLSVLSHNGSHNVRTDTVHYSCTLTPLESRTQNGVRFNFKYSAAGISDTQSPFFIIGVFLVTVKSFQVIQHRNSEFQIQLLYFTHHHHSRSFLFHHFPCDY